MKKNRIFGALSAAALLFAGACSNDVVDPNKNQGQLTPGNGSGVYMSIDFQLPTGRYDGTRSQTVDGGGSSDGTEIGSDQENFVSNALIVLAASQPVPGRIEEYGFIVAGEVPGNRIATSSVTDGSKRYRATASLQKENLNDLYQIYGDDNLPEVYVFVFCNPTAELLNMFDGSTIKFGQSSWIDATCEVLQSKDATVDKNVGVWGANSFLMNNVKLTTRELPKKLLDWEKFSTVENPFHLSGDNHPDTDVDNSIEGRGVVHVERSVARFDFKDGSGTGDNRYTVLYNIGENGDVLNGQENAQPIVDIQIQKMCLVNMCNKFYYLPRVSENGQIDGKDYALCGAEKPWVRGADGKYTGGNYLVGPYASVFGGAALTGGFSNYFNFPFFEDNGSFNNEAMSSSRWDVVKVADILGSNNTDNYNDKHEYHIWRYVTENVIPDNEDNQMNGISTGVVFKGKLLGNAAENIDSYYEEYWDKGSLQNLINCLNGLPFTYTADPNNPADKDHAGLTGKSDQDPILYYYGGKLYMGWRHIRQAAIQASVTINANGEMEINRSNSLFKAVFGDNAPIPTYTTGDKVVHNMVYVKEDGSKVDIKDPLWETAKNETFGEAYQAYLSSANYAWSEWALGGKEIGSDTSGSNTPESLAKMRAAVTGAGITIYQSSIDEDFTSAKYPKGAPGYYCYYYYWNRHADNGLNGSMGPMEFDVVRNNVYKLSIDKIARLGHPRIPENDPNNPKPEDPDESDEIYIDVRVEIAPWAVRINNIEF